MGRLIPALLLAGLSLSVAGATPSSPAKPHRHVSAKPTDLARSHYSAKLARRGPRPTTSMSREETHPSRPARAPSRTTVHTARSVSRHVTIYHKPILRRVGSTRYKPVLEPAPTPVPTPEPPAREPATETATATPNPDVAATAAETGLDAPATTPAHEAALPAWMPPAASDRAKAPTPDSLRVPRSYVPPLRGSRESLIRQNEKTEAEGLERIEDSADLNDRIARKLLVRVPASPALTVNGSLPQELRYCRPWTARFLSDMARAHQALFHRPILVSSAVRTVEYQRQLERINGNAAPAEGHIVSPHLTGGTIDIAKSDLPRQEIGWMRAWLKPLQTAGKIDVEEEFLQACFHITVYESYVPPPAPTRKPGVKPHVKRRRPSLANALAVRAM